MAVDESVTERLREIVASGGAVCLLGAGFSTFGTDCRGKTIPSTSQLIGEIKNAVGVDEDEDPTLSDIADYCEDSAERQQKLRKILIDRLTLCRPSDVQRTVINQPWRSIFTTNFDDLAEACLPKERLQIVTPTQKQFTLISGKTPLYHMHGRAKDLIETSIDPRIVISESNYLRLHEDNLNLYAQLQNEIFAAKLIVIVGYSMRDLEIARVFLRAGQAFDTKTVLIANPAGKGISLSRLEKFGTVHPIGVEGLALALKESEGSSARKPEAYQFAEIVEVPQPAAEITPDDFTRLILTGRFESAKYQKQLQQLDASTGVYAVRRSAAISSIVDRPADGLNRFVVSSDLGNGKTIFIEQLAVELSGAGYLVVKISSRLAELFAEIDALCASSKPVAFLIDDVIRYRPVAEYIGKRMNALGVIVCCMRGDVNGVAYRDLEGRLGGAVKQIDLNHLDAEEVRQWDTALERWGLWEQRISLSEQNRLGFLSGDCSGENRSIVLSLFKTSILATKIDEIVSFFLRYGGHERVFAALLTSSLCHQHVTWESIVYWLGIDQQSLKEDIRKSPIADMFYDGRNWYIFTSTQLAEHILRTKYVREEKDTLVEVFSVIVLKTAESANDERLGAIYRENLKELMKFRFLTRLFGEDEDAVRLINQVYSKLSKARYIRKNPQFWLQYAMSRMEVSDLRNAETYLGTALGLAQERGVDYSPFQILDQQARLLFLKNTVSTERYSRIEIRKAISNLKSLLGNSAGELIYLYRSVPYISDFTEKHIDDLDADLKTDILEFLESIDGMGRGVNHLPKSQKGETRQLKKAMQDALLTLRFA